MLKLTENGAKITLKGSAKPADNGLFWFGAVLLVGAVAVAVAMSLFPVRHSIAALALLVVASFVFNLKRQQQKKAQTGMIQGGILWVKSGELVHDCHGRREQITLSSDDNINQVNNQLSITDSQNAPKYQISGFDSEQEAAAAKAILQGQALQKRHANIKLQSDD